MASGTLKMWNADRGYGFIADNSGGPDMFLHMAPAAAAGIDYKMSERSDVLRLMSKRPAKRRGRGGQCPARLKAKK